MGRERERPKKLKLGDNLVIELLHKISFLHFSYLPASATKCPSNWQYRRGQKFKQSILVNSLTSRKSAHSFFPGKNPDPEIPEKSGFKISGIFDQILVYGHRKE